MVRLITVVLGASIKWRRAIIPARSPANGRYPTHPTLGGKFLLKTCFAMILMAEVATAASARSGEQVQSDPAGFVCPLAAGWVEVSTAQGTRHLPASWQDYDRSNEEPSKLTSAEIHQYLAHWCRTLYPKRQLSLPLTALNPNLDEFERSRAQAELTGAFQTECDAVEAQIRTGKRLRIACTLNGWLEQYDFSRKGFPVQVLSFSVDAPCVQFVATAAPLQRVTRTYYAFPPNSGETSVRPRAFIDGSMSESPIPFEFRHLARDFYRFDALVEPDPVLQVLRFLPFAPDAAETLAKSYGADKRDIRATLWLTMTDVRPAISGGMMLVVRLDHILIETVASNLPSRPLFEKTASDAQSAVTGSVTVSTNADNRSGDTKVASSQAPASSETVPANFGFYIRCRAGWTKLNRADAKAIPGPTQSGTGGKELFGVLGVVAGLPHQQQFRIQLSGPRNAVIPTDPITVAYRGVMAKEQDDNTGLVRVTLDDGAGLNLDCIKRPDGHLFPATPTIIKIASVERPERDLVIIHPALGREKVFAVFSGESEIYLVDVNREQASTAAVSAPTTSSSTSVVSNDNSQAVIVNSSISVAPAPANSRSVADDEFAKLVQREASPPFNEEELVAAYRAFARKYPTHPNAGTALDRARSIEQGAHQRERDLYQRAENELK